jgi:FKBP-type peptidyl-prolyl cis-trans isomerase SlyD
VTINAITDKTVTVDFNHPLAGKDLTFDIEVLKIRDATKAELAAAFPPAAPAQQPAPGPAQQPAQK